MPYADLASSRIYYVIDGPREAPVLMLSNSLGTCADMWAPQVPVFTRRFRVLRYDTRGHGRSATPAGEYPFSALIDDVVGLLDHLGIEKVHFCGLSMGGPTGMGLALAQPQRVGKLVLCNTAARIGSVESWQTRMEAVRQHGMHGMAGAIFERWLTPDFRASQPALTQVLLDMLRRADDEGYRLACAALRDLDLRSRVARIAAPALVIAGTHDAAATPEQGRELAAAIPGAQYRELNASHISNWECPDAFADLVMGFLAS
ncbi:3-oxoadipate enol-lactonase [Bordetella genomosp. 9]|uniref:3-oxoadipate enol-lactonase n=1 Tax=Bordetella genomosp. 9 TaxID=1416803 RepID=A0A1W6Z2J2_9BORD|nr:3-oxoadipate enol-lactonase [Bordetella genomosp. 9]ARP87538.1 3-oxoadipate enol-lactonase [Bordetella genomosp. 9]